MRKKVDQRVQILIDNCIKLNQRGFFIIVGDRGRDQVVNLHYLLTKSSLKTKPKVLWCYKQELDFSTHKKKRMKQISSMQKKGVYDADVDDPFELFVSSNDIRYCYYKDTHKVLGQTYQMLILQDFEALTPNILCRTLETVQGGGFVILLLNTMSSLKQLHNLTMDAHNRYKTDQFKDVQPRFNDRFMMSLGNCSNTVIMDDELNILPISSTINNIKPVNKSESLNKHVSEELTELKSSLESNNLVGPLVGLSKTLDQAKCVMQFVDSITSKQLRYTIALTAGRGRGKSASMGMSLAAAVAQGFSNIFITSPTPENLNTFFEFVVKGLQALDYKENLHYDVIQSTNPDFNNAIIRINIHKSHRQVIQYVLPTDYQQVGSADLVVIDEAASIPVDHIKKLIGPYLVFMASTVNGYEGTGRSLSLKLIQQLKQVNRNDANNKQISGSHGHRILKEISLQDPIRYTFNDPLEKWLNNLLLLEATEAVPLQQGMPHPNDCELYCINRDTLFSYKKPTEKFLFNIMSLFISSHYKNSPNDLQMLSDAPAHAIFVLLNSITVNSESKSQDLPDILCAVQVSLEGKISARTIEQSSKDRGYKPQGDLIPWILSEQFQDREFPTLSGARVVRIATHPAATKMGYGTRAIELLQKFFEGRLINMTDDNVEPEDFNQSNSSVDGKVQLKPILKKLTEIRPPNLQYMGVSYGLSKQLFNFWKKSNFTPLYLRQTKNEITSEHTCIMLKTLKQGDEEIENEDDNEKQNNEEISWENHFSKDFKKRFLSLLSYQFRDLDLNLALGVLGYKQYSQQEIQQQEENEKLLYEKEQVSGKKLSNSVTNKKELELFLNLYDLKRLEAYSKSMVDFHMIIDLLPIISKLFFERKTSRIHLSYQQAAILMGLGLQHKDIEVIANELNIPVNQCLALFIKAIKKFHNFFKMLYEIEIEQEMNKNVKEAKLMPVKNTLSEEMQDEGEKFIKQLQNKNLQGEKLNKKRKGRYNFEIDEVDQSQIHMSKNGDIAQIKRSFESAYNPNFGNKQQQQNQKSGGNKNGPKEEQKKVDQQKIEEFKKSLVRSGNRRSTITQKQNENSRRNSIQMENNNFQENMTIQDYSDLKQGDNQISGKRRKSCHCEQCGILTSKEKKFLHLSIKIREHRKVELQQFFLRQIKRNPYYGRKKMFINLSIDQKEDKLNRIKMALQKKIIEQKQQKIEEELERKKQNRRIPIWERTLTKQQMESSKNLNLQQQNQTPRMSQSQSNINVKDFTPRMEKQVQKQQQLNKRKSIFLQRIDTLNIDTPLFSEPEVEEESEYFSVMGGNNSQKNMQTPIDRFAEKKLTKSQYSNNHNNQNKEFIIKSQQNLNSSRSTGRVTTMASSYVNNGLRSDSNLQFSPQKSVKQNNLNGIKQLQSPQSQFPVCSQYYNTEKKHPALSSTQIQAENFVESSREVNRIHLSQVNKSEKDFGLLLKSQNSKSKNSQNLKHFRVCNQVSNQSESFTQLLTEREIGHDSNQQQQRKRFLSPQSYKQNIFISPIVQKKEEQNNKTSQQELIAENQILINSRNIFQVKEGNGQQKNINFQNTFNSNQSLNSNRKLSMLAGNKTFNNNSSNPNTFRVDNRTQNNNNISEQTGNFENIYIKRVRKDRKSITQVPLVQYVNSDYNNLKKNQLKEEEDQLIESELQSELRKERQLSQSKNQELKYELNIENEDNQQPEIEKKQGYMGNIWEKVQKKIEKGNQIMLENRQSLTARENYQESQSLVKLKTTANLNKRHSNNLTSMKLEKKDYKKLQKELKSEINTIMKRNKIYHSHKTQQISSPRQSAIEASLFGKSNQGKQLQYSPRQNAFSTPFLSTNKYQQYLAKSTTNFNLSSKDYSISKETILQNQTNGICNTEGDIQKSNNSNNQHSTGKMKQFKKIKISKPKQKITQQYNLFQI